MRRISLLTLAFAILAAPVHNAALAADKERDREVSKLQKEVSKLEKRYDKLIKRCTGDNQNRPDARARDTARITYQDVQELKKQIAALSEG